MAIYSNHVAVTPSDSADLPQGVCQAVMCTGAGNINCVLENGRTVLLVMLAAYANRQEFRIKRILAASTTATGITALYV